MSEHKNPFEESDARHEAEHGPEKPIQGTQTIRRMRLAARKNMRQGFTRVHLSLIGMGLIVIGLAAWFLTETTAPEIKAQWFYDLKTGQLFAGKHGDVPPIRAPSDAQESERSGVIAQVIRIEGMNDLYPFALITYTPEAKAELEAGVSGTPVRDSGKVLAGTTVAKPPAKPGDPIVWVQASSGEGQGIFMGASQLAGGKPYSMDFP